MAFVVPSFPLLVNFWTHDDWVAGWIPPSTVPGPTFDFMAQLRYPARQTETFLFPQYIVSELLFDVAVTVDTPVFNSNEYLYWPHIVEIPAASGRYYFLWGVERVAQGFPNEYKSAIVSPTRSSEGSINATANWPFAPAWP